jgi:dGTPase
LASNILKEEELNQVDLWAQLCQQVRGEYGNLTSFQMRNQVVRKMIDLQVSDVINETTRRLTKYRINSLEDARNFEEGLLSFSQEMKKKNSQLKMFLFDNMYRHYRMIRMADKAKRIIKQLFDIYLNDVDQLPPTTRNRVKEGNRMQAICDYIAGMTDRYALQEYKKLFDPMERV